MTTHSSQLERARLKDSAPTNNQIPCSAADAEQSLFCDSRGTAIPSDPYSAWIDAFPMDFSWRELSPRSS